MLNILKIILLLTFFIPPVFALTEKDKILHLIGAVGKLENCVFNRNGKSYSARDAEKHLQRKYTSVNSIQTAEQFIRHIGSKSSMSGQAYSIKCGENTISSEDFFRKELLQLEKNVK